MDNQLSHRKVEKSNPTVPSLSNSRQCGRHKVVLFSLHIRSLWETTVMHKQVSGWTVNFGPNFPERSLLRNTPPSPFQKTSDLGWPKFTPEYPPISENFRLGWPKFTPEYPPPPPHFGKLQIWDDQSLLRNTPPFQKTSDWDDQSLLWNTPPHFGKLQIWDDQSLLRNTPPISENFRFGMTKVYSGIPPLPPCWKTSDLGWLKFTLEYPPPPCQKTSDLGWPKFTPEYPPPPKINIVRESRSEIFWIPRFTTCGDFIQPG